MRRRTNTNSPAIAVHQLTKCYGPDLLALAGISLTVDDGEIFGFLGPNGAGKSTTLRILTTLARPDDGTASILGVDVLTQPDKIRRLIGVVNQKSGADPAATGRENLVLHAQLHGIDRETMRHRSETLLARFDLADAADRPVHTYSGGMTRKLDIALALIHQPRVLFLDEPTTGLDPESRAQMWRDLQRLNRDDGVTIFLTTHYLDEADRLADRIAIIDRGQIVVDGTPDELKAALRGDALHVELETDTARDTATAILAGVTGISEIMPEGTTLHARVEDGRTVIPTVFSQLDAAGVRVAAVTMSRPSLDDVYLRHAGRAYHAGNIETEVA